MNRSIALVALGLAFVAGGCSSSGGGDDAGGNEPPEKALERQVRYLTDGQAGKAYAELHPSQQAFIPQALYVKCVNEASGIELGTFKVKEVYDEEVQISGTDQTVQAKAVTVEIELKKGSLSNKQTDTYHEHLVDGRWRFTVSDGESYKAGRCP